ncbi:MAG: alpha/beta fold hydrolase [Caldilineaceae bacterium]|nr:alpha/beta fold hydrolase [Caldilineaceae bacterium]
MPVIATTVTNRPQQNQQTHRHSLRWLSRVLLGLVITLLVLAGSGATYQALATARDARTFPPPGQLVDVGGYKLHIYCLGTGAPTVITENGLGGSVPDWGLVQPAVSRSTRICSYDRAGSGWSEAGPYPRTSRQISTELHTLLANAGVSGPFVLVGHSAGGMHVQVYAAQYPAEVAGLVLVDPTPAQAMVHFTPEEQHSVLPNLGQFRLLQALQFFGVLRFVPLFEDPVLHVIPESLQAQIRVHRLKSGAMTALAAEAEGIAASIQQTAATTLPPELPLLILWHGVPAEPVALEPPARAAMQEVARQSKNGKFIVAENSGHTIPLERPDLVIAAINQVVEVARGNTAD